MNEYEQGKMALLEKETIARGLMGSPYQTQQSGKIYTALAAILGDLEAIGKNKTNTSQGFKFRGVDDVYNALHPLLAKHKVFSVPRVLSINTEDRQTSNGKPMIYRIATIEYRFYTDDGSYVTAVVVGEGADQGDKAMNKAMAVAHKYALFQVFTIPTEDQVDPDSESHEIAPAAKPQPAAPAARPPFQGKSAPFAFNNTNTPRF